MCDAAEKSASAESGVAQLEKELSNIGNATERGEQVGSRVKINFSLKSIQLWEIQTTTKFWASLLSESEFSFAVSNAKDLRNPKFAFRIYVLVCFRILKPQFVF